MFCGVGEQVVWVGGMCHVRLYCVVVICVKRLGIVLGRSWVY